MKGRFIDDGIPQMKIKFPMQHWITDVCNHEVVNLSLLYVLYNKEHKTVGLTNDIQLDSRRQQHRQNQWLWMLLKTFNKNFWVLIRQVKVAVNHWVFWCYELLSIREKLVAKQAPHPFLYPTASLLGFIGLLIYSAAHQHST